MTKHDAAMGGQSDLKITEEKICKKQEIDEAPVGKKRLSKDELFGKIHKHSRINTKSNLV